QPVQPQQPYDMYAQYAPQKKSKKGLITGLVCGGVAVVAAVVFVILFATGVIFAKPAKKVENAFKATAKDQGALAKALDLEELLSKSGAKEARVDFDIAEDMNTLQGTVALTTGGEIQELYAKVNGNMMGYAFDVDGKIQLTEDAILFGSSVLNDKLLKLGLDKMPGGYLGTMIDEQRFNQLAEVLKSAYQTLKKSDIDSSDAYQTVHDWFYGLEFEKLDKKEFEIDGKDVSCGGYEFTISADDIEKLIDDFGFLKDEQFKLAFEQAAGMSLDNALAAIRTVGDFKLQAYIYDGMLAALDLSIRDIGVTIEFQGGDYRTQNMAIAVANQTVFIKGSTEGDVETRSISYQDTEVLKYTYDAKSGDFVASMMDGDTEASIELNIKRTSDSLTVSVVDLKENGASIFADGQKANISFGISACDDVKELDGTVVDLGTLDEEGFNELADLLKDNLMMKFPSLFYLIG
ncbi:hypothetical protein, partial [Agathobacter ruminis]